MFGAVVHGAHVRTSSFQKVRPDISPGVAIQIVVSQQEIDPTENCVFELGYGVKYAKTFSFVKLCNAT